MSTPNAFTGARPKRAGDDFSRTHQSDPDDHSSKKIRFDPRFPSTLVGDVPDEDPVLELDEIGKSGGIKRKAVNIDGYESDSSTENFDLGAKATAKAKEKAAGSSKPQDDSDDERKLQGTIHRSDIADVSKANEEVNREVSLIRHEHGLVFDEWYESTEKGMSLHVGHYKTTPERETICLGAMTTN